MRRRPAAQPGSLTSLLDVLFILVFASLVQASSVGASAEPTAADQRGAEEASASPATSATVADAGIAATATDGEAADAAAPTMPRARSTAALQADAIAELDRGLARRIPVVVRVGKAGMVTALEVGDPARRIALGTPLLERVPDPDVRLAYLGDRSRELRICRLVALTLAVPDLSRHLVIIAPDAALADLPVALVGGLGRDAERCGSEQRGVAALVDQPAPTEAP